MTSEEVQNRGSLVRSLVLMAFAVAAVICLAVAARTLRPGETGPAVPAPAAVQASENPAP